MKINGIETKAGLFAYDGCHKIYLIEKRQDLLEANEMGYSIYPIEKLEEKYNESCGLRFINSWDLQKTFVGQFKKATFRW